MDAQTFVGMCTWNPFLSEAVERVEQSSVDRLVILPLFPQYSFTTTRAGSEALRKLLGKSARLKALNTTWISTWAEHPTYIESFSSSIERELAKFSEPDKVQLLFSAHSIPESYVREGDPYLDQTKASVERIMDRLGRKNPYQLSFQSKIGPVKWLEPATNAVIVEYGKRGIQQRSGCADQFRFRTHRNAVRTRHSLSKGRKRCRDSQLQTSSRAEQRSAVYPRAGRHRPGVASVSQADVVVVGAGITGLTCAYRLQKLGIEALVLESGDRIGGVIRSERIDGHLVEWGPGSLLPTAHTFGLLKKSDLDSRTGRGESEIAALHRGQRATACNSPWSSEFRRNSACYGRTFGSLEIVRATSPSPASFARRFGAQVHERLVAPFVTGIFAGNTEKLSVGAVFPRILEIEREYGSVDLGNAAAARPKDKAAKPRRSTISSFPEGLETLPRRMAQKSEDSNRMFGSSHWKGRSGEGDSACRSCLSRCRDSGRDVSGPCGDAGIH